MENLDIDMKNNLPLDILFLIRLKANEFKSEGVHTINCDDIKEYLYAIKWKDCDILELCDVIDDVMSLRFSDVFDYLKLKVIKEASSMKIDDFSDLITK